MQNVDTKNALAEYLSSLSWSAYFTATFQPKEDAYIKLSDGSRTMRHPAMRYSATAIDRVQHTLMEPRLRPTKMFIAAEQHMLGGWHCHGLVEYPQTKYTDDMPGFNKALLSKLGFNLVTPVGDLDACSAYLSKYLVKDDWHGDWRMVGRAKFWRPV